MQTREIRRALSRLDCDQVTTIGPGDWFRNGMCIVGDDEGSYYADRDHVSSHGARKLIQPVFEPIFKAMAKERDVHNTDAGYPGFAEKIRPGNRQVTCRRL